MRAFLQRLVKPTLVVGSILAVIHTRNAASLWLHLLVATITVLFSLFVFGCGKPSASHQLDTPRVQVKVINEASQAEPVPSFVHDYVNRYCIDCHDSDSEKGDVNLERDVVDWGQEVDRVFWEKVLGANHDKLMPPKKKSQPREAERTQFSDWIAKELSETPIFGVTKARRLSRDEYRNTMRALFQQGGAKLPLGFPEDNELHGFDNLSEGLVTSPDLLEAYSETAETVADLFYPRKRSRYLQPATIAFHREPFL